MDCDSSTTFLDCQQQNTFFSSHLSNWRTVLKDILVEWFEPKILQAMKKRQWTGLNSELKSFKMK